ncbi:MAG: UDP-N-acetylmuramoyl-tripeptide--D-alanyl-D-alanine ligase [Bacillota bacterium]|nr:UDP-N-acetylmuramoyl-tripeptide--D-alanyl-D-alanine ligase [Bacillota bacterium]MDK2855027.1 UDP-N-acetylmuramoyl-tripeptide--D-alanyl-D-alanine ligase [Bacillota bacterium]MDK2924851.1 UDP-N-acetylmuramoyl-tripeptide--D-alanyl-D-alanine ligase [Bacillota bacterium]
MRSMTAAEVARVTNGRLKGDPEAIITGVASDSRRVRSGDLFVAIRGERVDGHTFVPAVLAGDAVAALVEQEVPGEVPEGKALIRVADTTSALLTLGAWYRNSFAVRTVAITGSTGKTTTKDLTAAVLGARYATLKNEGNFNTEVGLPLTLFNLEQHHEVAVVELAMRGPGQIARLAGAARPEVGVITNIGLTHIELLGSQENIARAKGELLEALPPDGLAVLNGDDPWVRSQAARSRARAVYFGLEEGVDFRAEGIEPVGTEGVRFRVSGPCGRGEVFVPLPGRFTALNALAAIAVGHYFGLTLEEMRAGLTTFRPAAMRLNLIRRPDGALIINDAYNANPTSMRGALETLKDLAGNRRKVAVLGDMLELGEYGLDAHREIGRLAAEVGVECLITAGPLSAYLAEAAQAEGLPAAQVLTCADARAAAKAARQTVRPGDVVLVKASRGMHFEEVVAALTGKALEER